MATKVLIIYFNFFVNAFLYFGLTFNIGDLGGDVFLNFAISGSYNNADLYYSQHHGGASRGRGVFL